MTEALLTAEIEGFAARYGAVDLNGDIIAAGAFKKSLARRGSPVRMLSQHAADKPIGVWTAFRETEAGLAAHGTLLLETEQGRELYALIRCGALDGLSIGYRTVRARKDRAGRRHILEADLWEVSIVTFPMAPGARIYHLARPQTDMRAAFRDATPALFPQWRPSPTGDAARSPGAAPFRKAMAGRLGTGRAFSVSSLNARHLTNALKGATALISE